MTPNNTDEQIRHVFDEWHRAVKDQHAEGLAALYAHLVSRLTARGDMDFLGREEHRQSRSHRHLSGSHQAVERF